MLLNVCTLVAWLQGCLRVEMLVGQIGSAHVNQLTNKLGRGIEKNCLKKVKALMIYVSFFILIKLLCLGFFLVFANHPPPTPHPFATLKHNFW